ncbi:zinc-finger protein [Phlyctochytrium planicorne]|nr:zinc-finger protein [Phlyctochytrium planicorne]
MVGSAALPMGMQRECGDWCSGDQVHGLAIVTDVRDAGRKRPRVDDGDKIYAENMLNGVRAGASGEVGEEVLENGSAPLPAPMEGVETVPKSVVANGEAQPTEQKQTFPPEQQQPQEPSKSATAEPPKKKSRKRKDSDAKRGNQDQAATVTSPTGNDQADQSNLQRCRWATCTSAFPNTDDLLPHISRYHLAAHRLHPSAHPNGSSLATHENPSGGSDGEVAAEDEAAKKEGANADGDEKMVNAGSSHGPSVVTVTCHWAQCEDDKEGFENLEELVRHLSSKHLAKDGDGAEDPHSCSWNDCDHRFKTFKELTDHIATDHITRGQSEYVCQWRSCSREGRPFDQRQKIMRHIQTHTGDKPFECSVCKQRFADQNILPQHMRTHTGEKPFRCLDPSCGKDFAILGALRIHMRLHTGEKPFACTEEGCDKRFAESSNLTKHIRVHTGEKPFQCVVATCGKKFARPDQVARHTKTHEKK